MIHVSLVKKKVVVVPKTRDDQAFKSIIQILKDSNGDFHPEKKIWTISPLIWGDVGNQLQEIEDIVYEDGFLKKVEEFTSVITTLKTFDDPFSRRDLKVAPIKGKEPFVNYQLEDIGNSFNTNRFAFFNDPGTGKTYEYMSTILLQRKYRNAGKVVFVTSNSGVYNMYKEFSKFTDIPSEMIAIGGVKNRRPFDDHHTEVVIMSYRSFLLVHDEYNKKKDGTRGNNKYKFERYLDKWLGNLDGILILDESHNIANPSAQQTEAVLRVKHLFEYIYLGSGTPADKLEKYYSQLKAMDGSLVHNKSYTDWKIKYFNLGTAHSRDAISEIKPDMVVPLQNIVRKVSSRRLADEVLVLPEHIFKKVYTEFSPLHREIYEMVVLRALEEIQEDNGAVEARKVQQIFPYLIMAVDNPLGLVRHFGERITNPQLIDKIEKFKFSRDHAKVEMVQNILEDHPGEKFILWTSHPSVGLEFETIFAKKKPFILNGETSIPKGMSRDEYKLQIVEDFQNDPKRDIAIFSTQTMNSSLNIVKCSKQIIIDASYNYVELEQFLKRIHRIGQDKTVTTWIPLIDKSMDVTRRAILEDKEFVNKFFLSDRFLDKGQLRLLFSMEGLV